MKKVLLTALLLVPFFSLASLVIDPSSDNILYNGTVPVEFPETSEYTIVDCKIGETVEVGSLDPSYEVMVSACRNLWAKTITDRANWCGTISWTGDLEATYNFAKYGTNCEGEKLEGVSSFYPPSPIESGQTKGCPPEGLPDYVYSVYVGEPSTDNLKGCAKPSDIQLFDSCNASSTSTILNKQVDSASVCLPTGNGSVCNYDAVDIGGGNQVYQLDLEGNCYLEDQNDPDPSGYPDLGNEPIADECTNNGGLLACPADPDNVCDSSNSTMDGGIISTCNPNNASCGYVNGSFLCYDVDTDSDGLPDYNDPDIDGDGIRNDDDIDADGDGHDDPLDSGNGSSGGGNTTVNVDFDDSRIVSELQKANNTLTNIEEVFDTSHGTAADELDKDGRLTQLNNDYQDKLENFIAQGSAELGYVDKLTFTNEGKLLTGGFSDGENCKPYNLTVGRLGEFNLDFCKAANFINPMLYWFFGMLTAFYIFYRVNNTVREN
jgi:hypothetical protein